MGVLEHAADPLDIEPIALPFLLPHRMHVQEIERDNKNGDTCFWQRWRRLDCFLQRKIGGYRRYERPQEPSEAFYIGCCIFERQREHTATGRLGGCWFDCVIRGHGDSRDEGQFYTMG